MGCGAPRRVADLWWQPTWISITYNGCGDHHCLDLAPTNEGKIGQIISMWHDSEERDIFANNFKQWFEHLVRKYDRMILILFLRVVISSSKHSKIETIEQAVAHLICQSLPDPQHFRDESKPTDIEARGKLLPAAVLFKSSRWLE